MSDKQCAERIANHFASISQKYKPLDLNLLPDRVKSKLATKSIPPLISEHECYEKIVKAKKPQSSVPGDLPAQIVKEFSVELAGPVHKLLNNIVQSAIWPEQWKTEYVTPIGKVPQPESEDDLRPIALTSFWSKVMEQFVVMWLLEVIGDNVYYRQYGGNQFELYLAIPDRVFNFILYNQDSQEPMSVLTCLVDFRQVTTSLLQSLVTWESPHSF